VEKSITNRVNKETLIRTTNGDVWHKIIGEDKRIPLIVVHGGPGCPHDYLEPLEDLSKYRKIIFYDQIGCGLSSKIDNPDLMVADTFIKELGEITESLKLDRFHLLGHSWGSGLVCAFALDKPKGLQSIILSDSYLITPVWEKDAKRLIKTLPEPMQRALGIGNLNSDEFKNASTEYYKRYVSRLKERPEAFDKMMRGFSEVIYTTMWGPKEFLATGTLKSFDLVRRLHEIDYPVLLATGRFDEATPESAEYFQTLFPNSEVVIFEDSAHYPFWSERNQFIQNVEAFLEQAD